MIISQEELMWRQSLTLDEKVLMTRQRLRDYVEWSLVHGKTPVVSMSGGVDSTVLTAIARLDFPEIPLLFSNTGLEFPEIVDFVRTFDNVHEVRPKKPFHKVVKEYGWPVVSKKTARMIRMIQNPTPNNLSTRTLYLTGYNSNGNFSKSWKIPKKWFNLACSSYKVSEQCCDFLKKEPLRRIGRELNAVHITGTMAEDSQQRRSSYLQYGCNVTGKKPISRPMSFWTKKDVWDFVHAHGLKYCSVYDMGYENTGCIFCGFGVHLEKEPNRFQLLKRTHPKQYDYVMNKLGMSEVLKHIKINH
jgi:3'-phosphoadenosine 5'-phosphosulfate sulfotransferase (PAPS reductase)/FAD synthetase